MLRSLVAASLSWRLLVIALALAVAGLGTWAFMTLPVDAYPNIAQTQVKIILKAPGMTPEEVESRVITPIEMEMLGIPDQAILRSTAKYAIADITIDFVDGTDIYWARQQVAERLSITERTVGAHLTSVYSKLGARNKTEAILLALKKGILLLDELHIEAEV